MFRIQGRLKNRLPVAAVAAAKSSRVRFFNSAIFLAVWIKRAGSLIF